MDYHGKSHPVLFAASVILILPQVQSLRGCPNPPKYFKNK